MLVRWAERMGRQVRNVLLACWPRGFRVRRPAWSSPYELVRASVSQLRAQLDRHIREAIRLGSGWMRTPIRPAGLPAAA